MKKLFLSLSLIIFLTAQLAAPAFAICDYSAKCAPEAYDLSPKNARFASKITGMTFLSEKIAQMIIRRTLRKETKAKFKVQVKAYSANDLINGRFKFLKISGKNLNFEGVYITSLDLITLCDFNYVQYKKNPMQFKENMIIGYTTVISDADLQKTMDSNGYLNKLNCVDVKGCGITFFKLSGAGVSIKNNKLYFTIKVTSQLLLAKPLDISIATDLKVEDGRIVLTKLDLGNVVQGVDLTNVAYQLNAMNPLTFSLKVLENPNTKMCIRNVKISGDKIIVNGNIFIPKNATLNK